MKAGDRKLRTSRAAGNPVGGSRGLAIAHWWTAEEPSGEVSAAVERLRRAEDVAQVAVMPDVQWEMWPW